MDDASNTRDDRRKEPRPALSEQAQKAKEVVVQREKEALKALEFRQERDRSLDIYAKKQELLREHLILDGPSPPPGMTPIRKEADLDRRAEVKVAAANVLELQTVRNEATVERLKAEAGQKLSHDQQDRRQLSEERDAREERRAAAIAQAKDRLGMSRERDHERSKSDDPLGPEEVTPEYIKAVEDASPERIAEKEATRDAAIAATKDRFAQEAARDLDKGRD